MDDVQSLLNVLPAVIAENLENPEGLIEIIIDEGRPVEYRYLDNTYIEVVDLVVDASMLNDIEEAVGDFGPTNRAGITKTLHRISRIQNRLKKTIGMTCRVGRTFEGCVRLIEDLVLEGHNVLLLGQPGIGKTTKLRDIARYLSSEVGRRVVIVDTTNEIGGDGNLPHPAIGRARRMQVPQGKRQHHTMKEAVENHMPQTIVVDEISDAEDTETARTIAQRGVQLIATAHGSKLSDLVQNPPLCGLIGGVKTVVVSDAVARNNNGKKSVQERQFPPVFDVVVELTAFDEVVVYRNVSNHLDVILAGGQAQGEVRRIKNGVVKKLSEEKTSLPSKNNGFAENPDSIAMRLASRKPRMSNNKRRR